MYDLERYLTVRSAYGASLGPDGELAFLMDTTGVAQLWQLTEPGAWPEQRTFYDDDSMNKIHKSPRGLAAFDSGTS